MKHSLTKSSSSTEQCVCLFNRKKRSIEGARKYMAEREIDRPCRHEQTLMHQPCLQAIVNLHHCCKFSLLQRAQLQRKPPQMVAQGRPPGPKRALRKGSSPDSASVLPSVSQSPPHFSSKNTGCRHKCILFNRQFTRLSVNLIQCVRFDLSRRWATTYSGLHVFLSFFLFYLFGVQLAGDTISMMLRSATRTSWINLADCRNGFPHPRKTRSLSPLSQQSTVMSLFYYSALCFGKH